MAFKMRGNPMQRNFGIGASPLKDAESRRARKAEKKIQKGKQAFEEGKFAKAERKFKKAIKKDPKVAESNKHAGKVVSVDKHSGVRTFEGAYPDYTTKELKEWAGQEKRAAKRK